MNKKLVLISGVSGSSKSASLRTLKNPEGVMFLNGEAKALPFASKFKEYVIVDPNQITEAFAHAETDPKIHTIIIEGLNFIMDMYESLYIIGSSDSRAGWTGYAQYFKTLMQQTIAKSTKHVIVTAHTLTTLNEGERIMETKVPIKGALKNMGIESYFSTVVSTKVMPIADLEPYKSDKLTITPEDEQVGIKYCYQTRLTADTVNSRVRGPLGMFPPKETFIDSDAQMLMDILDNYYA